MSNKKIFRTFLHIVLSIIVTTIVTLVVGEIWFRLPCNSPLLDYEYNDTLLYKLKPNQRGCILQGGGGIVSPPITINKDGFRNDSINWKYPAILCLGSSEVLGTGVKDNECWTYILQQHLLSCSSDKISVVNAGSMSYGPYHALMILKSFLNRKHPDLVILRVATGDKDFQKPSQYTLSQKKNENKSHSKIKKMSKFIPFLLLKAEAQQKRIRNVFTANKRPTKQLLNSYEIDSAAYDMWNKNGDYLREIGNICDKNSIQLIFVIYDPIETPATTRLETILEKNMSDYKNCSVIMLGSKVFGLDQLPIEKRKEITIKTLRIPFDPHSNALQHRIVGKELAKFILNKYDFFNKKNLP
jgi:hypothetical protein